MEHTVSILKSVKRRKGGVSNAALCTRRPRYNPGRAGYACYAIQAKGERLLDVQRTLQQENTISVMAQYQRVGFQRRSFGYEPLLRLCLWSLFLFSWTFVSNPLGDSLFYCIIGLLQIDPALLFVLSFRHLLSRGKQARDSRLSVSFLAISSIDRWISASNADANLQGERSLLSKRQVFKEMRETQEWATRSLR